MDKEGYMWDHISNTEVPREIEKVATTYRLPTGVVIKGASEEEAQEKLKNYISENVISSKHLSNILGLFKDNNK